MLADMDPAVASLPYFSRANVDIWVNIDKWHEYQLNIRRLLSQSASGNGSSPRRVPVTSPRRFCVTDYEV